MVSIDNNKNKEPNSVYKTSKTSLTLLLDPNKPISINKGGNILSKNM